MVFDSAFFNPAALPPLGEEIAVAVSGGADSFALLHRLYAEGRPVVALTVDHGLREGSAVEAQTVARWCARHDIPHETLRWEGVKPEAGIQASARSARYRLLCEACNRLGIHWLLTGHTADDQAETVFMRLRRGASRGLAGMPPTRSIAGGAGQPVTLARPMLTLRRADARSYAVEHDLPIQDDPSNDDPTYERIRVRAVLAALEQQGLLTVGALCGIANQASDSAGEAELTMGNVQILDDGAIRVPSAGQAREHLSWAISAVGHAGRWDAFDRTESVTTLGGASVTIEENQDHLVYREPAALLGRADGTRGLAPTPVKAGERHVFDRRFIVDVPEDVGTGAELRPLGQSLPKNIATSTLARQRVVTLPCLVANNRITHIPLEARQAVAAAFEGWKAHEEFLGPGLRDFRMRSLLQERFLGNVIRY